ncbi:MAG: hypothetical protein J0L67_01005 [Cytophagales bacterium]|nr:hypothetical protein [Cytophagales bacterium]
MGQEFKLLYEDNLIGTVVIMGSEFLSTSGQIELNSETIKNNKVLKDFIDFSFESSEKVLGNNEAYEEFIDKEEFKYQSIIDSLDWRLISKEGIVIKILVPVFFRDNEINFRFQE